MKVEERPAAAADVTAPPSPAVAVNGGPPDGYRPATPSRRRRPGLRWVLGAIAALLVVGWAATARLAAPTPATPTPAAPLALTAHGVVQPIGRANVATMTGGVVD